MTDAGTRIRQLREAQRWSVTDLADLADVDPGRLRGMEDGSVRPSTYECQTLEATLPGCSPQELGVLVYGETYREVPGFDATIPQNPPPGGSAPRSSYGASIYGA